MRNPGHPIRRLGWAAGNGQRATGNGHRAKGGLLPTCFFRGRESILICHRGTRCGLHTLRKQAASPDFQVSSGRIQRSDFHGGAVANPTSKTAAIRMAPLNLGGSVGLGGFRGSSAGPCPLAASRRKSLERKFRLSHRSEVASRSTRQAHSPTLVCGSAWGNCSTEQSEQERPIIPDALDFALTVQSKAMSNRQMWASPLAALAARRANCGWKNGEMGLVSPKSQHRRSLRD